MTLSEQIRKTVRMTQAQRQERRTEMFRLKDQEHWTLEQIGAHYGITKEAVRQQLAKGPVARPVGLPTSRSTVDELLGRKKKWAARPQTEAAKARIREIDMELEQLAEEEMGAG